MTEPLTLDVAEVWRRWEPRFIAAGVDWNILQRLHASIDDWSEWCAAWSEIGDELSGFAEEAFAEGRALSASGLWAHAALLYHFGGMYFISDREQMQRANTLAAETFAKAAPHFEIPAVPLSVPFAGSEIKGYLRVPPSDTPPPVVLFFSGFEGTKEENQVRTKEFLERGLATLSWDGPGRGESEHIPMTGDVTPIAGAWIDLLSQRGDVDVTRIGATGPNRGAHAAAKTTARESRITALAAASPGYDRRSADFRSPYEIAFFLHLFHLDSEDELRARLTDDDLTMEGEAQNIRVPSLIVAGDRDFGPQFEGSKRLVEEISGEPKRFVVVKGAERNGNNVPYLIRPLIADFLAEHLGA